MRTKRGTIWVRIADVMLPKHIHGRRAGDIVEQHVDSDSRIQYAKEGSNTGIQNFREATETESQAYQRGIRNIKDIGIIDHIKFKEGDILEFISKDLITTCFSIGEHVTFIKYHDYFIQAKDKKGTNQSAYAKQFKFVKSADEQDTVKPPNQFEAEVTLRIPGFEVGDIVECKVKQNSTISSITKGDKIKIWEIDLLRRIFKGENPDYTGKDPWCGLDVNEFQPFGKLITENNEWKIGDKFTLNPDSEYFKDQGFDEDSNIKVFTITQVTPDDEYSIDTDFNCYRPEDITPYIPIKKIVTPKFKEGDKIIGNAGARCYAITRPGVICIVESIDVERDEDENQDRIRVRTNSKLPQSYSVNPDYFDLVINDTSYKFQIGDVVKVISSGWGIGDSDVGKTAIITKQGKYSDDQNGYICSPRMGNCVGTDKVMVGEKSFELILKTDPKPPYTRGIDPFKHEKLHRHHSDWKVTDIHIGGTEGSFGFFKTPSCDDGVIATGMAMQAKWLADPDTTERQLKGLDVSSKESEIKMPKLFKVPKI